MISDSNFAYDIGSSGPNDAVGILEIVDHIPPKEGRLGVSQSWIVVE